MAKEKKVVMTADIMAKLRGISIVSNTIDFKVEIDDVPDDFLPVFTIKNLTVYDTKQLKENINKLENKEDEDALNNIMEKLTMKHIVGWKNLYDLSTGEEWTYDNSGEHCTQEQYDMIPTGVRSKILTFLYELTGSLS